MHPLRKLRESGKPTPAQVSELLAENIVFNSPILARPIEGREVIAAIFAQSSSTRGSGTYTAEFKLDERTTFLRWVGTMDGHKFESLEIIVDNEQGLIVPGAVRPSLQKGNGSASPAAIPGRWGATKSLGQSSFTGSMNFKSACPSRPN
jgi:hypothetical protein